MTATVTIPRELAVRLQEHANGLAFESASIAREQIMADVRDLADLLAQPQPDRVKVLEDAVREHREVKGYIGPPHSPADAKLWSHLNRVNEACPGGGV